MTLFLVSIAFMINLIIGMVLYTRVRSLADCSEHEQRELEENDWWIIIVFWSILGIIKLWREGVNGL